MLLNCGVGETIECPLDCKEIQPVHPKGDQSWVFIGRTDAEAETPVFSPPDAKRWLIWPWLWKRLKAGWDGWVASPTRWTWVWVNSGIWWWSGKPGVLWFMGHRESGMTEQLNWTELVHWQADSSPLSHQGSPSFVIFSSVCLFSKKIH